MLYDVGAGGRIRAGRRIFRVCGGRPIGWEVLAWAAIVLRICEGKPIANATGC